MSDNQDPKMDHLITALAMDAVNLQKILDQNYQQEMAQFQGLVAEAPEVCRELLRPIMPERQAVRRFEIQTSVAYSQEMSAGFSLKLEPLSLGYQQLYGFQSSRQSKISVAVECVSPPKTDPTK